MKDRKCVKYVVYWLTFSDSSMAEQSAGKKTFVNVCKGSQNRAMRSKPMNCYDQWNTLLIDANANETSVKLCIPCGE